VGLGDRGIGRQRGRGASSTRRTCARSLRIHLWSGGGDLNSRPLRPERLCSRTTTDTSEPTWQVRTGFRTSTDGGERRRPRDIRAMDVARRLRRVDRSRRHSRSVSASSM
jgi:hypothetical protein